MMHLQLDRLMLLFPIVPSTLEYTKHVQTFAKHKNLDFRFLKSPSLNFCFEFIQALEM